VRYESPDVFETLTKEWSSAKTAHRPRRRMQPPDGFVLAAETTQVGS
jgi:tRNA A58 N-methylase Trm61